MELKTNNGLLSVINATNEELLNLVNFLTVFQSNQNGITPVTPAQTLSTNTTETPTPMEPVVAVSNMMVNEPVSSDNIDPLLTFAKDGSPIHLDPNLVNMSIARMKTIGNALGLQPMSVYNFVRHHNLDAIVETTEGRQLKVAETLDILGRYCSNLTPAVREFYHLPDLTVDTTNVAKASIIPPKNSPRAQETPEFIDRKLKALQALAHRESCTKIANLYGFSTVTIFAWRKKHIDNQEPYCDKAGNVLFQVCPPSK